MTGNFTALFFYTKAIKIYIRLPKLLLCLLWLYDFLVNKLILVIFTKEAQYFSKNLIVSSLFSKQDYIINFHHKVYFLLPFFFNIMPTFCTKCLPILDKTKSEILSSLKLGDISSLLSHKLIKLKLLHIQKNKLI